MRYLVVWSFDWLILICCWNGMCPVFKCFLKYSLQLLYSFGLRLMIDNRCIICCLWSSLVCVKFFDIASYWISFYHTTFCNHHAVKKPDGILFETTCILFMGAIHLFTSQLHHYSSSIWISTTRTSTWRFLSGMFLDYSHINSNNLLHVSKKMSLLLQKTYEKTTHSSHPTYHRHWSWHWRYFGINSFE